jgi:hypothetical protein
MVSRVMPNASFCVNKVLASARRSGSSENGGTGADEVGFPFSEHGAHGWEGRLHDRVVPVGLESAPSQHRPHGNVDGAAHGVGREHLAFQIGDGFDRTVLEHHELVGAMTRDAVLDFVADDVPQHLQALARWRSPAQPIAINARQIEITWSFLIASRRFALHPSVCSCTLKGTQRYGRLGCDDC